MVIPVSNPSFGSIQTELGGSNPITMGEYYAWTEEASATSTVNMSQFRGGFGMTVGKHSISSGKGPGTSDYYGYSSLQNWNVQNGSVTSTTMIAPSGTLGAVYYATTENRVTYVVTGSNSNSGWTTLTIKGYTYSRASATSYTYSSPNRTWIFTTSTNPFGGVYGDTTLIQVV
jgi:hypothetical protein